jgi:hypothetical protein
MIPLKVQFIRYRSRHFATGLSVPKLGEDGMELEPWRVQQYLVRAVEVAQAELDRGMLDCASVDARERASRFLETFVNRLLDSVVCGTLPPELKRLI